ncbi:hypothetical protein BDD12DRAFT_832572, partial [Trichophaea hybrida]
MTTPTLAASKSTVKDDDYHSDNSRFGCSRKRDQHQQQQQAKTSKPSVTIHPPYLRTPTEKPESIHDVYSAAHRIAYILDALSRWFQPNLRLRITQKPPLEARTTASPPRHRVSLCLQLRNPAAPDIANGAPGTQRYHALRVQDVEGDVRLGLADVSGGRKDRHQRTDGEAGTVQFPAGAANAE